MKKIRILVALILLICALGFTPAYATGGAMQLAQISEKNVAQLTYLRTAPNDNADITFGYNKGVFLMILSEDANGWCHVSIGNQRGYIKKSELTTDDATTSKATLGIAQVSLRSKTSNVNLRELPSLDAEIVDKLRHGTEVIVLGIAGGWSHVLIGEETGYIKDEFLLYSGRDTKLSFLDIKAPLVVEETRRPTAVSSKRPTAQPNVANPVITAPPGVSQAALKDSFSMKSGRGYTVSAEFKATGNGKYQIYIRVTAPAGYVENDVIKSFNAYINGSRVSVPQQGRNDAGDGSFEATYSTTTSFAGFIDTVHIAPVSSGGNEVSGEDMFFSNILAN